MPAPVSVPAEFRSWLSPRPPSTHKYDVGHVLIIGGALGSMGAPRLAAWGALRAGAGVVTIAVPRSQQSVAASDPWEALTLGLPETAGRLSSRALSQIGSFIKARRVTSVVVGPGLGVTTGTQQVVRGLLRESRIPVVVDADALNALAGDPWPVGRAPRLLTPHAGELARLLGRPVSLDPAERERSVRAGARLAGGVCVLKGHVSLVSNGSRLFQNSTGNPGMATAGSGDVLAGVLGALLGQVTGPNDTEKAWRAACLGVWAHGRAGDVMARRLGQRALMARDIADGLAVPLRLFDRR